MQNTIDEGYLAAFRVRKEGNLPYMDKEMSPEEVMARRAYIRQALRDTPRNNLPNDTLDNIRLTGLDNSGFLFEDEQGNEFYIRAAAITGEEAAFRKCRSMIPFEFMGLKARDFSWSVYGVEVAEQKGYVNSFILKFEQFRDKGMGLYIFSATKGSGKTMLACCLLNEISERYAVSVKFINALDLLELTKESYKGREPEELKALYTATVLVMDDIGVQMSKEWTDTVFYRLVNTRYTKRLVTVYTSNTATDALKMDDRITDRIESTTYLVELPEVPVRHNRRTAEKEEILREIENAP